MATIASFPGGDKPTTFAAMLTQLTAVAHARLPENQHGRLEMGHAIVVQGGVFPEEDGVHFSVCSQEGEEAHTYLVNAACPCKDAQFQAPQARCKHWFAALLYKRTLEELAAPPAPEDDDIPAPTLDAAAETHKVPKEYLELVHGRPFILYKGLLAMAHEAGLVELHAEFISVTAELALAKAQAVFADGKRFSESADATPSNVGPTVQAHFARVALTRAKARCLRDALNIGICSLEELGTFAEVEPVTPPQETRWCDTHQATMTERVSKRTGSLYWSHEGPDGKFCFGD
jgi:hypothetical protein